MVRYVNDDILIMLFFSFCILYAFNLLLFLQLTFLLAFPLNSTIHDEGPEI